MRRHRPSLFLKGKSTRSRRYLLAVFALIFGATSTPAARAACVELAPLPVFGLEFGAIANTATADIDGDGDLDFFVASSSDVVWFEGSGDTALWTPHVILAALAQDIQAADIDGDGDIDAVAALYGPSRILWFENSAGDGSTWVERTISTAANFPFSLAAGDLDHDGDLDLIATSLLDERIAWFANDGTGDGWTLHAVSTALGNPASLVAADFDRDGDLDLAVRSNVDAVVAWFENSDGSGLTWTLQTIATGFGSPSALSLSDLDRDGDSDLLVSDEITGLLLWFANDGAGGGWSRNTIATGVASPRGIGSADLDRDGDLDVLSYGLSFSVATQIWRENNGVGGGWTVHTYATVDSTGGSADAVDLDGDGDPDPLLGLLAESGAVFVARNDLRHGSALFGAVRSISTVAVAPRVLRVADIDRDGDPDPILVNSNDAAIDAWPNDGTAASWTMRELTGFLEFGDDLQLADLDGDGDSDFVAPTDYLAALLWFRNNGAAVTTNFNIDIVLTDPVSAAVGDFDGQGRPDVAVADKALDAVFWYRNDGTPATGVWTRLTVATGIDGVSKIAAVDVDRDGDLDLLAIAPAVADRAILWLDSNGAATPSFTRRTIQTLANTPLHFAPADIDGDGDLDLWLAAGAEILWLESDSTPAAGAWTVHSAGTVAKIVALESADFDGDGDVDLAFADDDALNGFQLIENEGGGSFSKRTLVSINAPRRLAAADLDRDGDLDLAIATSNAVAWVPNLGTKVFDDGYDSDANSACWSNVVP